MIGFYPPPLSEEDGSERRICFDIDSLFIFTQDLAEGVSKIGQPLFNNSYYFIMIIVRNDWSQALP